MKCPSCARTHKAEPYATEKHLHCFHEQATQPHHGGAALSPDSVQHRRLSARPARRDSRSAHLRGARPQARCHQRTILEHESLRWADSSQSDGARNGQAHGRIRGPRGPPAGGGAHARGNPYAPRRRSRNTGRRASMNRRTFLRQSAVTGTALALAGDAMGTPAPADEWAQEWFGRPMRWAQLTLVEDDPGTYDLNFWLDYFRRTHSDAACLSAGGCVAYYPTKIPLHYRSQWLGTGDAFGDLVAGCRKLNMVVVARTDPHAAHQDVCDQHPDWIAVNAEGQKIRHPVMPALWVTCALGPYNFDFMTSVTKEIVALYKVDGIFSNRWSGSGMCYCEHCRANFRAASGLDLPRTGNPHDPSRRAYIGWRQQRLFELWRLWDGEIQKINPAARYIPNSGGGAGADLDMKTIGELAPILFADRQARSGVTPPWAC